MSTSVPLTPCASGHQTRGRVARHFSLGRSRRSLFPVVAAIAASIIVIPARLSFLAFLRTDAGANLAATTLAHLGRIPNVDFGYPFGPLALGLQLLFFKILPGHGPLAMTALSLLAILGFGAGAGWAIWRLRLDGGGVALLTTAAAVMAMISSLPPVYALEATALLWAVVTQADGRRGGSLACCTVAALLKPSMGVVLGAVFLIEAVVHGQRLLRLLRLSLAVGVGLTGALMAEFGPAVFFRLALPLAGARNYQLAHFSFFSAADNPFVLPGANLHAYLGQPMTAWGLGTLLLAGAVATPWRRQTDAGMTADRNRRWAALGCALGTLAFIAGFYSWKQSYANYATLPLVGLAILPGGLRWPRGVSPARVGLAALALLGLFTVTRDDLRLWTRERPAAVTAGLWASPAQQQEWNRFARRNPPATRPLFLVGSGSPEALFPQYGPPWHAYLYFGEATPTALSAMNQRAATTRCAAVFAAPGTPEAPVALNLHRLESQPGSLFTVYGCN